MHSTIFKLSNFSSLQTHLAFSQRFFIAWYYFRGKSAKKALLSSTICSTCINFHEKALMRSANQNKNDQNLVLITDYKLTQMRLYFHNKTPNLIKLHRISLSSPPWYLSFFISFISIFSISSCRSKIILFLLYTLLNVSLTYWYVFSCKNVNLTSRGALLRFLFYFFSWSEQ